jgi:hypothetical protein
MITEKLNRVTSTFLMELAEAIRSAGNLQHIFPNNPEPAADIEKMAKFIEPHYEVAGDKNTFNHKKTNEYTFPMHREMILCFEKFKEHFPHVVNPAQQPDGPVTLKQKFDWIDQQIMNEAYASCGDEAYHQALAKKNSQVTNMLRFSINGSASAPTDDKTPSPKNSAHPSLPY